MVNLNTPQKNAVEKKEGALLVVAGAGSGKTRVITARMANLIINEHVDPKTIVALTFTNKAAGEMKKRLSSFLPTATRLPFVGTFHAYCLLLLRINRNLLPFNDFSIIDVDDQKTLLKKLIKKGNLEKQISVNEVKRMISKEKNQLEPNKELFKNRIFKELYLEYETEKRNSHCLDFDDLILSVMGIFKKNKEFKKKFQTQIEHILVDEYQDTNGVQHELLKEMALNNKKKFVLHSLCAVGDEDQSIYSWRGARAANMLAFQKDFSPVSIVKIEQNYRSIQPILKAANSVIENNTERHPKKLWSEKKGRNRILYITCKSGYQEAEAISTYIQTISRCSKIKLGDLAILYRTHFQSRIIEESLIRNAIPYKIIGGIRFYERKEIKDLMAYLRLIVNPFDKTSLFRIINRPARGLGAKFEEELFATWNNNPFLNFKEILAEILKAKRLTKTKADAIKKFLSLFKQLPEGGKPTELLEKIIGGIDYLGYIRKSHDAHEAETKIENIQEFANSIETTGKISLADFLHQIALLQEKLESTDKNSAEEMVQMMTLHAVKGLEFNTVLIAGLEEGLLPSSRSMHALESIEEERRLFYVGMTRAMERLILLRATYRSTYGQICDQEISPFLTEIPTNLMQHIDATSIHIARLRTLVSQWIGAKYTSSVTTFSPKARRPVTPSGRWKKNQPVTHKKFGAGLIQKVEKANEGTYHLTILFRTGKKRILSTFVQSV